MENCRVTEKTVRKLFIAIIENKCLDCCQHELLEKLICSLTISSCDLLKMIIRLKNQSLSYVTKQYLTTADYTLSGDLVFSGNVEFTGSVRPVNQEQLQVVEDDVSNLNDQTNGAIEVTIPAGEALTVYLSPDAGTCYSLYNCIITEGFNINFYGTLPYNTNSVGTTRKFTLYIPVVDQGGGIYAFYTSDNYSINGSGYQIISSTRITPLPSSPTSSSYTQQDVIVYCINGIYTVRSIVIYAQG